MPDALFQVVCEYTFECIFPPVFINIYMKLCNFFLLFLWIYVRNYPLRLENYDKKIVLKQKLELEISNMIEHKLLKYIHNIAHNCVTQSIMCIYIIVVGFPFTGKSGLNCRGVIFFSCCTTKLKPCAFRFVHKIFISVLSVYLIWVAFWLFAPFQKNINFNLINSKK